METSKGSFILHFTLILLARKHVRLISIETLRFSAFRNIIDEFGVHVSRFPERLLIPLVIVVKLGNS